MKVFIQKIFLFFSFAVVFYLIALVLWGSFAPTLFESNIHYKKNSYGFMDLRIKEFKEVGDLDILFLGSSRVYRGLDPRNFEAGGYSSFNLGSSAQAHVETQVLVRKYLDGINPKLIIYDVSPATLESDGVESSLDIIANDDNDIYSYSMALKVNNIKTYNTLLYATIIELFGNETLSDESLNRGKDRYISGGYVEREVEYYSPSEIKKRNIEINDMQLRCFEENVAAIKDRDIHLIFITVPVTGALFSSFSNYDEYDSLMSSYGEYYNFNRLMTLDDSLHFFDESHLNQLGVDEFNNELLDVLSRR